MAAPKRGALGNNPLSQGIFTKTVEAELPRPETSAETELTIAETKTVGEEPISRKKNQESRIKKEESRILIQEPMEKVNLRLSVNLNDWLDELLKQGKRRHGRKIPKEVWVQAALELFKAMPVDWTQIESEADLKATIKNLESRFLNQDS